MNNYLATVTIGDCIGPEFAACLALLEDDHRYFSEFLTDEQAEFTMSTAMSQSNVWDRLWRFGIIVDEDMSYYMPNDWDSDLQLVELEEQLFIGLTSLGGGET